MDRRTFIGAMAGGLLAAPLAVKAQQAANIPRVGFLSPSSLSDPGTSRYFQALRQGLRELGYVEGQNIAIESRWAAGEYERLPGLAAELVRLKMDVIVAAAVPAIRAAKEATSTIPIIMAVVVDPMATGLVASLARPEGNITGFRFAGFQRTATREALGTISLSISNRFPTSSGCITDKVTHHSCEQRRLQPEHWGCDFNPWRRVARERSTTLLRR